MAPSRAGLRPLLLCAAAALASAKDFLKKDDDLIVMAKAAADDAPAECGSLWLPALEQQGFTYEKYAGKGATACVFLAVDKNGQKVAVKVSKSKDKASLINFKRECGDMHLLRLMACKKGEDMLSLHEAFLPTCLEASEIDGIPYIVMHAAPTVPIDGVETGALVLGPDDQKAVFAQLIAGVYALHGIDKSHNDLHGNNIVLDTSTSPASLALIDFGEVTSLEEAQAVGYKRDGNAIWRWTAQIAKCDASALWENSPDKMTEAKPKLLECLSQKWKDALPTLPDAMGMLADADIAQLKGDQKVGDVYQTMFVRDHLPALQKHYSWEGSAGCTTWDAARFTEVENEAKYGAHYKCDTVPSFNGGSDKVCVNNPTNNACFSLKEGIVWACGAALMPKAPCITVGIPADQGGGTYDGACLMPKHEGYKYAIPWGDAGASPPSGGATTTTEQAPEGTTTTEENADTPTPTPAPAPVQPKEGGGFVLLLVKVGAVLGAGVLCFFLYKQSLQAREPHVGTGVEMNER